MGTNGTDIAIEFDRTPAWKSTLAKDSSESAGDFALAPLVDKIAFGIAKGLVEAVRELDHHIAGETRKVGDTIERRLDALQVTLLELSTFVAEQRSTNVVVEDRLQQLTAADAELRETDTRQAAGLEALRAETSVNVAALQESAGRQSADLAAFQSETRALSQSLSERTDSLCRELGVHQEDMAAVKATLSTFCSRADALAERLDRQAEAVRSMCTAYSQRETELEQLVDGLARLRAYPTPLPANGL